MLDIADVFDRTGVLLGSNVQYLSSEFGAPLRRLCKHGVFLVHGWRMTQFDMKVAPEGVRQRSLYVEVGAAGRDSSHCSASLDIPYQPLDVTTRVLRSSSAGTDYWRILLESSRVRAYLGGGADIGRPSIRALPSSRQELAVYLRWLAVVVGSQDRLVDGWGHPIRLTISGKAHHPLLIASSAGPDGRWGTKDDVIVERDTKTGRIVKEVGF